MLSTAELQQRWQQLESALAAKTGKCFFLDEILLLIGISEAGIPSKRFTEMEREELKQLAVSTILAPAKYYELIWVDATGRPHYKQLKPLPFKESTERENFLKEYVLLYDERNKLVKQSFSLFWE
jgi:hypothetical protein